MTVRYCKIVDNVVDAGLGPYAGWLYTVIVRHVNRKSNELSKTVKELAALAGMSARSVIRYTKVLEAKNLLRVRRSQTSEVADVNVYSLAGEAGQISLFNGVTDRQSASDSQSQRAADAHVPQSHCKDSLNDNTPNDGVCVPDWALQEIHAFRGLSPDWLVRDYGAAKVLAVVRYANQHNLGVGFVITELRDNRMGLQPADLSHTAAEWKAEDVTPEVPDEDDAQDHPYKADQDDTEPDGFLEADEAESKLWATTVGQLEVQLGWQTASWLKAVTYSHTEAGVWVMRCPANAVQMLQHRLYREIRRVVRDVRGEMIELRFESAEVPA